MASRRYTQDPKDLEKLKLHFARSCWKRRNELTPSGRVTWSQRFEEMFGVSLGEYAKEMKKKKDEQNKRKVGTDGEGTTGT